MLPAKIVGTVVKGGACVPFELDTPSGNVKTGSFAEPHHDMGMLGRSEKGAVDKQVRAQVSGASKVRVGEYRCPKCDKWIDVTKSGSWNGDRCSRC